MKTNGKIYGNEKTHLRLSSDGQDIYDSTCPLRIVEHEIRDDNDEIVDYRYSVTGCLGDRHDLTEEDLEQFLLDSMPSYFFPDAEYVDDWFGSGDPVCMSAYEVNRLIREWTQPDGEPVDYWSQLHKASVDEINKYDFCD